MAQIFHFHAPSQRKNPDTAVASESAAKKAPRLPVRKLRFAIYAPVSYTHLTLPTKRIV